MDSVTGLPSAERAATNDLRAEILDEVTHLGPKLAAAVPDFVALYLAGPPAVDELDLVDTGAAWLCEAGLSFVLVSDSAIPAPTLRCLEKGMGLQLGGLRVCLRHMQTSYLTQQLARHREGFLLAQHRELLAGDDAPVTAALAHWHGGAAPEAAENLLVDSLDLLLRAEPSAPLLARQDPDPHAKIHVKGALLELSRNLADALLLLHGHFAGRRTERAIALRELPPAAPLHDLLAWAFGPQPLLEDLPAPATGVWNALRHGICRTLAVAVGTRIGKDLSAPLALLANVRACRRSLRSRLRRALRGKHRAGGREFTQLLLLLCLAVDDVGNGSKSLCGRAARVLSQLGGPILANPTWRSLRRETLLLGSAHYYAAGYLRLPREPLTAA